MTDTDLYRHHKAAALRALADLTLEVLATIDRCDPSEGRVVDPTSRLPLVQAHRQFRQLLELWAFCSGRSIDEGQPTLAQGDRSEDDGA